MPIHLQITSTSANPSGSLFIRISTFFFLGASHWGPRGSGLGAALAFCIVAIQCLFFIHLKGSPPIFPVVESPPPYLCFCLGRQWHASLTSRSHTAAGKDHLAAHTRDTQRSNVSCEDLLANLSFLTMFSCSCYLKPGVFQVPEPFWGVYVQILRNPGRKEEAETSPVNYTVLIRPCSRNIPTPHFLWPQLRLPPCLTGVTRESCSLWGSRT